MAERVETKPDIVYDENGQPYKLVNMPTIRRFDKLMIALCALNSAGLIILSIAFLLGRR